MLLAHHFSHHFLQLEMLTDGVQSGWSDQPLNRFIYNYRSGLSFVEANLGITKHWYKKFKKCAGQMRVKRRGSGWFGGNQLNIN
jgi:hypothetical protein